MKCIYKEILTKFYNLKCKYFRQTCDFCPFDDVKVPFTALA